MQETTIVTNIKTQMRKGILEYATLLIIGQGKKTYSSDILEALKKADMLVVEGTLYPLLSRLKTNKLLEYSWQESKGGPPRKYYVLTKEGKQTLQHLTKAWSSLSSSIQSLHKNHEKNT